MAILLLETIDSAAEEILGKVDNVIVASEPTASDENLPPVGGPNIETKIHEV